jgi:CubicO group peptidase (beta-lactamase class C family)
MPDASTQFQASRAIVDRWTKVGKLPGASVLVQQHGQPVLEYASGYADLERKIPATTETIWAVASVSKPVAATALMQLVDAGKVDLDQPVVELLPDFGPDREKILVQHLVTHMSGLPEEWPDREILRTEGWAKAIATLPLLFTPGTRCSYSTTAFQLLWPLVYKFMNQDWTSYTNQHLFTPLGMRDSSFSPPASWDDRIAVVYDMENSRNTWPNDPEVRAMQMVGGGLFSTLRDLAAFGQAFLRQEPGMISAESKRKMTEVQTDGLRDIEGDLVTWGLGWYLNMSGGRGELLSEDSFYHGGATTTVLAVDPARDLVIVFLANRVEYPDGSTLHAELIDSIIRELEPERSR